MTAVSEAIQRSIATSLPNQDFVIAQSSLVGPKVGKELQASAMYAIVLSFIVLIIYIGIRFRFPYGVAAIAALVHDVIITLGFFALMAILGGWEISLPIIAALLTIVGYSLNDTIVVFDRIRENTKLAGKHETLEDIINTSVNQTLSRTLITSGTTLVVILAILFAFFKTGNVLETFSAALLVGIGIGTYSSIFVASPILILWNQRWPLEH